MTQLATCRQAHARTAFPSSVKTLRRFAEEEGLTVKIRGRVYVDVAALERRLAPPHQRPINAVTTTD